METVIPRGTLATSAFRGYNGRMNRCDNKDPQMEIIRLKQVINGLETKNNLLLLKHNLVRNQQKEIERLNRKVISQREANWKLTVALDDAKERLEQQEELIHMVLYKPVDNSMR